MIDLTIGHHQLWQPIMPFVDIVWEFRTANWRCSHTSTSLHIIIIFGNAAQLHVDTFTCWNSIESYFRVHHAVWDSLSLTGMKRIGSRKYQLRWLQAHTWKSATQSENSWQDAFSTNCATVAVTATTWASPRRQFSFQLAMVLVWAILMFMNIS